ncbi:MAG: tRNA guanosine(34) transglycosylase Tgt [Deltaproteobacteria bacterium]|nr:tRNA guanosine(34) transglycosylase Tgt [Deltaproteobacteria bacterium]
MGFDFKLIKGAHTTARLGRVRGRGKEMETPLFMPVGTHATVKAMTAEELSDAGVGMILANAYHLYLRPGHGLIKTLGGLHSFMNWDGLIITDSGGFQVYSLCNFKKIEENGIGFRSHLDGSLHFLTPETAIEIQEALGSDIMMVLDECAPYPSDYEYIKRAMGLTHRWARRCKDAVRDNGRALFGIVQGGMFSDLRKESAVFMAETGFDGYAIGGLSVGEDSQLMHSMIEAVTPRLPLDNIRYLMGVGRPEDIVEAVARGVDIFDCVMPTRCARSGTLFTKRGKLVIKNSRYREDPLPVEEGCACYTCRNYSRAYLRHLFLSGEILASRLNTMHNIYYYTSLMQRMRDAIRQGGFEGFRRDFYNGLEKIEDDTIKEA